MMRWDTTVLRESPWYNEILEEGRQEEGANLVLRLLKRRLGELSEQQAERIRQLSVAQLEELGEALLDFTTMADLDDFLAQAA